jgi:N-acylneuraminate cytidylyltransferase
MKISELYIVALIPARCGSKGIPHKNIKLYKNKPLLVHSIDIAKECKYIKEIYVSTDSEEYQNIAIENGANITPLRPIEISDDLSPDIDTFLYFIKMFKTNNLKIPDLIIHLRPTYPNRKIDILNECIEKFIENYEKYDSLRTVVKIDKTPIKMYHIENNNLIPYFDKYQCFIEPFNQARQNFPDTYLHNGCIDIVKTELIINNKLLSGTKIYPYIMNENETDDIDNINDFNKSENKIIK